MSISQTSMVASRMIRFGNHSLQSLIRRQLRPSATTSAAGVELINNAPESQFRPPFYLETPISNQLLSPHQTDGVIQRADQIGQMVFPGLDQSCLFARGDPINIDDEFDDDDGSCDDEDDDDDDDEDDDDEDVDDFDQEDFDEDKPPKRRR